MPRGDWVEGALLAVAEELNRRGWRRKSWTTKGGRVRVGGPWNNVYVHRLLTHPIYIGRQTLGDESFPGENAAIITKPVFDRVQRMLEANRRVAGGPALRRV